MRDEVVSIASLRQFVPPADIAGMILYLCPDSGRSITGQALRVDCGVEGPG